MTNPLRDPRDRRIPRVAEPCVLIMFGVTGDLARKKLLPAIYDLANRGLLPPGFSLVGFARRDWADEDFAQLTYEAVRRYARTPFREPVWRQVREGVRFVAGEFSDAAAFDRLAQKVAALDAERSTGGNYAFYLSVPPGQFPVVVRQLERSGLHGGPSARGWRRVVIEKPFGHDLASARELNDMLGSVFPPHSVFRIDHYLGKETVQNLLALRFANTLFEPIWNRRYVDHVQITMAEDVGIGSRAGYYDGIAPDSGTETYAAVRLGVDTRRWAGVPFYLRTGKRLPTRMTEIAVIFQRAPHLPFNATDARELGQNALVVRVQPDEGVTLRFGSKVPGSAMEVRDVNMDFAYGESFTEASPEAYERLLLDVLVGDPPLFPRHEEVELSWMILDPIEEFWAATGKPEQYPAGSSGPASADALMARDGRAWRRL